jgi:hypothetical protein
MSELQSVNMKNASPFKFSSLSDEPMTICENDDVATDLTKFVDVVYQRQNLVVRDIVYTCI